MDKDVYTTHLYTHNGICVWNIYQAWKQWNLICPNMDGPESIILSEISKEKDKYYLSLLICGI